MFVLVIGTSLLYKVYEPVIDFEVIIQIESIKISASIYVIWNSYSIIFMFKCLVSKHDQTRQWVTKMLINTGVIKILIYTDYR